MLRRCLDLAGDLEPILLAKVAAEKQTATTNEEGGLTPGLKRLKELGFTDSAGGADGPDDDGDDSGDDDAGDGGTGDGGAGDGGAGDGEGDESDAQDAESGDPGEVESEEETDVE